MPCSRVTYQLQWSMFSGCGVFPVLIAAWWIVSWHDCCSLTRPGQGNRQTMLGGGRKAWSKTLQSTTREVSFSFSFPKSLSCDVQCCVALAFSPHTSTAAAHTSHNPFDVCDGGLGTDAFWRITHSRRITIRPRRQQRKWFLYTESAWYA